MAAELKAYNPQDLLGELKLVSQHAARQIDALYKFFREQAEHNNQSCGVQQIINPGTPAEKILVDPQIFGLALSQYRAGGLPALKKETHYHIHPYALEASCGLSSQEAQTLYVHLRHQTPQQSTTQTNIVEIDRTADTILLPKSNASQFSNVVTTFKTSVRIVTAKSTTAPLRTRPLSQPANRSMTHPRQKTHRPKTNNPPPEEKGPLYTLNGLISRYYRIGGAHAFQGVTKKTLTDLLRRQLIAITTDRGIYRVDKSLGELIDLSGRTRFSQLSPRALLNEAQPVLYDILAQKGYLRGVNVTNIKFGKIGIEPNLQRALHVQGIVTVPFYQPQYKAPKSVRKMAEHANAHLKAILDTYQEQLTIHQASEAFRRSTSAEQQKSLKELATKFAIEMNGEVSRMNEFMRVNETLREQTREGTRYRRRFNREFLEEDRYRYRFYENRVYAVDDLAALYEQKMNMKGALQGIDQKVLKLYFAKAAIAYAKEKWRLPSGDDAGVKPQISLIGTTLNAFMQDVHQRVAAQLSKDKALNGVNIFPTTIDQIKFTSSFYIEPNTLSDTRQHITTAYPQLQIPVFTAQPDASPQVISRIQAGTERIHNIAKELIVETAQYLQSTDYAAANYQQRMGAIHSLVAQYDNRFRTEAERTRKAVKSIVAPFSLAHENYPEPENNLYTKGQLLALYENTGLLSRFQGIPDEEVREALGSALIKHAKNKNVYRDDGKSEPHIDLSGIGIDTFMKGVHAKVANRLMKARYLRSINVVESPVENASINDAPKIAFRHLGIHSLNRYEAQKDAPPKVKQLATFQDEKIQSLLAIGDDVVTTYKRSLTFFLDTPQVQQKKITEIIADVAKDISRAQKQFANDIEKISESQTEPSILRSRRTADTGKVDARDLLSQRQSDMKIEGTSSKKRREIEATARSIKYFGMPKASSVEKFAFMQAKVRMLFKQGSTNRASSTGVDIELADKVIAQAKKDLAFQKTTRKEMEKQLKELQRKAPFRKRFLGNTHVFNQRRAFLRMCIADAKRDEHHIRALVIKATELLRTNKLKDEAIDSLAKIQSDTTLRDEWKQIADMSKEAGMRQNPARIDADQTNNTIEQNSKVVLKGGDDGTPRAYIRRSTAGSQHNHWRIAVLQGDSKIKSGAEFKSAAELNTGDIVGGKVVTANDSLAHNATHSNNITAVPQTRTTRHRQ